MKDHSPESQLEAFMDKFTPEISRLAKTTLERLRRLIPGAVEMVYDNYYALVIGFGPTERPSEAVISIAVYPRWINLFFLNGVALNDPRKILKGAGKQVRRVLLETEAVLDHEDVLELIRQSIRLADPPFRKNSSRRLIIKAIAPKQMPRKPRVKAAKSRTAR